ncbi:helix-turn-helix transcriptional regulator [Paenibacillus tengchongensis]|uniref:helix-turn-helix transcriptional regulator n=1 Tax=Paenibacillus tengchongensis TaxID=2608684 RepID=UPI00124CB809|nr:WYL domain-containing protein [Paenibacillus tengchongensis]
MRADRLITIMLLLQNRGKMTAGELAATLEVSERTVVRDMEALSAAGIPIFAERGRAGGWSLSEGFRTSLTGMKPQELGSLLLSADPAILRALGLEEDFSSAVRKLEAAAAKTAGRPVDDFSQRIHIDGEGWRPTGEAFPYLSLLQQAVLENRKTEITYNKADPSERRLILPLGLIAKRGVWYVAAEHGGTVKSFRVSRITEAHLTNEHFQRPVSFDLAAYWKESSLAFRAALPRYEAEILVTDSAWELLQQERYVTLLGHAASLRPGWRDVKAQFNTAESALRIILSLGPGVRVTAPRELAAQVISAVKEITLLYEEK